jgi:hypothetical protein
MLCFQRVASESVQVFLVLTSKIGSLREALQISLSLGPGGIFFKCSLSSINLVSNFVKDKVGGWFILVSCVMADSNKTNCLSKVLIALREAGDLVIEISIIGLSSFLSSSLLYSG